MADPEYVRPSPTLSDGTPNPHYVEPGGRSILHGIWKWMPPETQDQPLSQPVRAATLAWLSSALASASGRSVMEADVALRSVIAAGDEPLLDNGDDFVLFVYLAADLLGCDGNNVVLTPAVLHS